MNQWQIWTVVKPTVGLPLLLGSVAVTSLLVHYAILSHTTWYRDIGKADISRSRKPASSTAAISAAQTQPAFTVSVAPVAATSGKAATSFVVTVTPNGAAAASAPVTVGDASSRAGQVAVAELTQQLAGEARSASVGNGAFRRRGTDVALHR